MRTLKRQYAARNWTFVRLLPDIAAYCRVVGPGEIRSAEFEVRNGSGDANCTDCHEWKSGHRRCKLHLPSMPLPLRRGRTACGPHKSAWDRLGPDKFFSPRKTTRAMCFKEGREGEPYRQGQRLVPSSPTSSMGEVSRIVPAGPALSRVVPGPVFYTEARRRGDAKGGKAGRACTHCEGGAEWRIRRVTTLIDG